LWNFAQRCVASPFQNPQNHKAVNDHSLRHTWPIQQHKSFLIEHSFDLNCFWNFSHHLIRDCCSSDQSFPFIIPIDCFIIVMVSSMDNKSMQQFCFLSILILRAPESIPCPHDLLLLPLPLLCLYKISQFQRRESPVVHHQNNYNRNDVWWQQSTDWIDNCHSIANRI
jgi:hypothetical protein